MELPLNEEERQNIIEQLKQFKFAVGREDYEIFLESPVWEDLSSFISERIAQQVENLENLANDYMADVLYKGRLHELRMLLAYPNMVIEVLKTLEDLENVDA